MFYESESDEYTIEGLFQNLEAKEIFGFDLAKRLFFTVDSLHKGEALIENEEHLGMY